MAFSYKYLTICFLFFHLISSGLQAQVSIADSAIRLATLSVSYRGGLTDGGWQDRWTYTSQLGLEVGGKLASNLYTQLGVSFLFTDRTQNFQGLSQLLTGNGSLIITDEGFLSEVAVSGRGLSIPLSLGYIIPAFGPNDNSGIYVEAGGQFLMHRFNFRVVDGETALLEGDYAKGYDQMRWGWGLREGVGYTYFDNKNAANFSLGLDFAQVPTFSGRQVFFPTGALDTQTSSLDLIWGFKFSWIYTIYQRAPTKAYYH